MKINTLKTVALSIAIAITGLVNAQDTIHTKYGENIPAKVYEITQNEVKYQKASNLEGPIYTVNKSTLVSITYKNGTEDKFNSPQNDASKREVENSNTSNDDVYNQGQSQPQQQVQYTQQQLYTQQIYYNNVGYMLGMWGLPYYSYYSPFYQNYYGWRGYNWNGYGWRGYPGYGYGYRGGYYPRTYGIYHGGYNGGYHNGGGYHGGYNGVFHNGGGGFHGGHHR